MNKETLEQAVKELPPNRKSPKNLFRAVVDFLRNEGDSEILTKWVMDSLLAAGELLPPHSGEPIVSCIIPCYNQASYLRETVLSVLRQDFPAFEIIIINDGSTDNTNEVANGLVKEFSNYRIRYVEQENSGLVNTRNRGCVLAKGKYILPLDSDDLLAPSFLSKTVKILNESNHLGYVSTLALFFGHSNLIWPRPKFEPVLFISKNQQTCTTLFRKSMWEEVGGYEKEMVNGYEDWELWIRATKMGWLGTQIEEPLFFYRRKENSMITDSRERDVAIKTQIILLHPDIYDKSKLKSVMTEMTYSNWIPPQLVRPDFKIRLRHIPEVDQSALAKKILNHLGIIVPQLKNRFSAPESGTGKAEEFEKLYNQLNARILKIEQNDPDAALDLSALLLSLYPLKKNAVTLFINSLRKAGFLNEALSAASFYLDLMPWNENLLDTIN
ncbi:glycosyltransferase family A protein [Maridesulfovibrio bastinii]|uniref:glycosyltransferase family A protein n=1 Tax=Maridesulfovibrio bastinii TaxID=47157 RepID=UPI00146FB99B|nr:glycosyltransferase family A protein [Maridesulfovibrio bastinii]